MKTAALQGKRAIVTGGGSGIGKAIALALGQVGASVTRSVALELARTNVTVNAVCPGYVYTDMVAKSIRDICAKTGRTEDDIRQSMFGGNPQGRLVTAEEVANAVLWLCLPGSESITGQSIAVGGGELM